MTTTLTTTSTPVQADRYLTFTLGRESYGIPALQVREIIRHSGRTPVPAMPEHAEGVLDLRGELIPLLDLRTKFTRGDAQPPPRTCLVVVPVTLDCGIPASHTEGTGILIVHAALASGVRVEMGIIVDAVGAVTSIPSAHIQPTPDWSTRLDPNCISGLAWVENRVIALLDINRVVAAEETPHLN